MAKYYYNDEKGNRIYIKKIDTANCKLEFTTDENKAYDGRDGYYATPLRDKLRRLFSDDYPEVANIECDARW